MKSSTATLCVFVAALAFVTSAIVGARLPGHYPRVHDEFSYLLAGQTFSQFRLTNPTPPLPQFFESHHVLLQPTMMSKYPPGQGLALAVGYWLGQPIYGVWLTGAAFAAAVAWMLRGFFGPRWALLGGLLTVAQFGSTHYWAQTFWGGALAATGGALVIGGARRLWRTPQAGSAALFGLGLVLLLLTRPFEGLLVSLGPLAVVGWKFSRRPTTSRGVGAIAVAAAVVAGGLLFLVCYNHRVTGSAWRLPYLEYEHRYAGTPYFVWQTPSPAPAFATPALADYYRDYLTPLSRFHGTPAAVWAQRLWLTANNFLGPVLLLIAGLGLLLRRRSWMLVVLTCLGVASLAFVLSYWFSSHYQAGSAALYLLLAVAGSRELFLRLPRRLRHFSAAGAGLLLAVGVALWCDQGIERDLRPRLLPSPRQKIVAQLQAIGGRHLVFVQPVKPYDLHATWVANDVPLGSAPVLWAWDRGEVEDRRLMARFPDRSALRMQVGDAGIVFTPLTAGP